MSISRKGFTLVEVMIAMACSVTLFAGLVTAFLSVKATNMFARHHIQAMQVIRGRIELLKVTPFAAIVTSPPAVVPFDAGPDGIFWNGIGADDDLKGTVTVTVGDFLDMDNDGKTLNNGPTFDPAETSIDIDGDGANDPLFAKPIRVEFTWNERVLGQNRICTASADTLIAS